MKKMILSLLAVLCCATVHANNHPAPGKLGVTAEYLYFLPSIDDTYYIVNNAVSAPEVNANPILVGKRLNNDFRFNTAYRVGGVYAFCTCERAIELTYTHCNQKRFNQVAGDFLTPTLGPPAFVSASFMDLSEPFENYRGIASSNLDFKYNRVDGLFSQGVFECCGTDIYFIGGLEYAYFHLDEHYIYHNTSLNAVGINNQYSHAWGVGPELGFEFNYAFWDCNTCLPGTLSLIVKSTGSLLASEMTTGVFSTATDSINETFIFADFKDKKTWRVIPALHVRFGLGYEMRICRYDTSLEIGYEFNSYLRGFARSNLVNGTATPVFTEYNNFDLRGLYVSASVGF